MKHFKIIQAAPERKTKKKLSSTNSLLSESFGVLHGVFPLTNRKHAKFAVDRNHLDHTYEIARFLKR